CPRLRSLLPEATARAAVRNDQKAWFLRVLLVLQSPRSVFAALRDDSDEVADARQDAAGAIIWLAGIAAVLATTVASTLLDDPARDWVVLVGRAFLAGGLSGFTLYFFLGKVLHVALRRLGSRGSFRRARHLLAFAAAPVALALFVYWPVRIAIYGEDLFRFDGSDGGTTGTVFAWIFYAFLLWGLVLLVIGVRTVHGWTWARSIAGVAWAAAIAAGLAVALTLLYAAG
ncbi:MAG: YIP1 family protein, partial [Gaiellaceae bacterium]